MKDRIRSLRWRMADWLSYAAVRLRGQRWHLASACYGVHGNRAAELNQMITDTYLVSADLTDPNHFDRTGRFMIHLDELSQLAGENWGHMNPTKH
jgi:hypothetical protein